MNIEMAAVLGFAQMERPEIPIRFPQMKRVIM
jgi:hypothetical protein